jgi:hypothetical protein
MCHDDLRTEVVGAEWRDTSRTKIAKTFCDSHPKPNGDLQRGWVLTLSRLTRRWKQMSDRLDKRRQADRLG